MGTSWSPESHAVKDFLSRHQTPCQWVDLEVETELAAKVEALTPDLRKLPVVLFPDGPALVGPTPQQLGERIGLRVRATLPFYDVVERDDHGFVLTGPDLKVEGKLPKGWALTRDPFLLEASVPGIFAAGDIRRGSQKRVASTVGEGSSAIGMIHEYLETV